VKRLVPGAARPVPGNSTIVRIRKNYSAGRLYDILRLFATYRIKFTELSGEAFTVEGASDDIAEVIKYFSDLNGALPKSMKLKDYLASKNNWPAANTSPGPSPLQNIRPADAPDDFLQTFNEKGGLHSPETPVHLSSLNATTDPDAPELGEPHEDDNAPLR
jgi:hypothetical protein